MKLFCPLQTADQQARPHNSVPTAIARWFNSDFRAGAEIDLSSAYDTVIHHVANLALTTNDTPPQIADTLSRAWAAPRYVVAHGEISLPIIPRRSVPQGDPCAGDAFSSVTSPWATALTTADSHVGCLSWVDDRTIGEKSTAPGPLGSHVSGASANTTIFDADVGFIENL